MNLPMNKKWTLKFKSGGKKFILMGNIKENLTEQTGARRNETSFSIMK